MYMACRFEHKYYAADVLTVNVLDDCAQSSMADTPSNVRRGNKSNCSGSAARYANYDTDYAWL